MATPRLGLVVEDKPTELSCTCTCRYVSVKAMYKCLNNVTMCCNYFIPQVYAGMYYMYLLSTT